MFKEKYDAGKELRTKTPRSSHAAWQAPANRPTVQHMIELSNYDRLPELVPIRHYRMGKSPFVFYRATASLMARDLSSTPNSGIVVQACGDCHLMNFGGFATPERTMVLDMNDFDETLPAPWEWDVKRLATSFLLACREKNFSEEQGREMVMELVSSYRDKVNEYAEMNFLELWYTKLTFEDLRKLSETKNFRTELIRHLKRYGSNHTSKSFTKSLLIHLTVVKSATSFHSFIIRIIWKSPWT